MRGSGDGWTTCGLGHRHWGLFGAAGLLLRSDPGPEAELVLQLRSAQSHHGGTWGIPGGACDEGESAVTAALRESGEEAGLTPADATIAATFVDDHDGWSYTTVIATAVGRPDPHPVNFESDAIRWVRLEELDRLPLHEGFARTWPLLRDLGPAPVIIVDAANTVGSRPDGWWRDRAGAATRLRGELGRGLAAGVSDTVLADGQHRSPTAQLNWFPTMIMVTEGAARGLIGTDQVDVVAADGSGDDTVVMQAALWTQRSRPVVVVTSDRALRARVEALGAVVIGPRSLLTLIAPGSDSNSESDPESEPR